jgi:hypothetical protein
MRLQKMSFFKRYYFLILFLPVVSGCHQQEIQYTDFYGNIQNLNYLESKEILLFYPDKKYNRNELKRLLQTYDSAYLFAARISGQHPGMDSSYGEKLTIAVVPTTCGSGCGKLGMKGIEFTEEKFKKIFNLFVESEKHDHLYFYELGRNFWFYDKAFTLNGQKENAHIRTGFAIFLRNVILYELGVDVEEINGKPYAQYMRDNYEIWENFKKNNEQNFLFDLLIRENVHLTEKPILWSMYWWSMYESEGFSSKFLEFYLQEVKRQKVPDSIDDLVENFTNSFENSRIRH